MMKLRNDHRAWTGGSGPRPLCQCSVDEIAYITELYADQCTIFLDYWKDKRVPSDVANTFWQRARCDAHATFRQYHEKIVP